MPNVKIRLLFIFSTLLYLFSSTVIPTFASISYTYDADGNMTTDGSNCYTYNEENQVSQVKNCGTNQVIATYVYDYQGNRLIKKNYVNGTLNNTVYSPEDEYETKKMASNGTTQNTTYYFSNGQQIAKKNPDGTKNYVHNDDLGSSSVLTDASGAVVENTTYDPWGEVKTGGTKDKFQYTGQEKDSETGLDYYNFRYYNSHTRRFTQPDDIFPNQYDPQQLNRYSYVGNNPLTRTDPTGHCIEDFCIGEAAIYAGVVTSSPDFQQDTQNFAEATGDFSSSPNLGTGVGVALAAAAVALPGESLGSSPKGIEDGVSGAAKEVKSWTSFSAAKRELGSAGEGNHWHHIVEQNKANIETHGAEAIHNTNNLKVVPAKVNQGLNGFYSSKQDFSRPLTVRQWLAPKSYAQKLSFGMTQLNLFSKNYKKK